MKKRLAIVILAITITALWVTPALAAKGVITDVNPSGIGSANQDNNPSGNSPGEQGAGNANGNAANDASGNNSAISDGLTIDPSQQGKGGATECPTVGCQ